MPSSSVWLKLSYPGRNRAVAAAYLIRTGPAAARYFKRAVVIRPPQSRANDGMPGD